MGDRVCLGSLVSSGGGEILGNCGRCSEKGACDQTGSGAGSGKGHPADGAGSKRYGNPNAHEASDNAGGSADSKEVVPGPTAGGNLKILLGQFPCPGGGGQSGGLLPDIFLLGVREGDAVFLQVSDSFVHRFDGFNLFAVVRVIQQRVNFLREGLLFRGQFAQDFVAIHVLFPLFCGSAFLKVQPLSAPVNDRNAAETRMAVFRRKFCLVFFRVSPALVAY